MRSARWSSSYPHLTPISPRNEFYHAKHYLKLVLIFYVILREKFMVSTYLSEFVMKSTNLEYFMIV